MQHCMASIRYKYILTLFCQWRNESCCTFIGNDWPLKYRVWSYMHQCKLSQNPNTSFVFEGMKDYYLKIKLKFEWPALKISCLKTHITMTSFEKLQKWFTLNSPIEEWKGLPWKLNWDTNEWLLKYHVSNNATMFSFNKLSQHLGICFALRSN